MKKEQSKQADWSFSSPAEMRNGKSEEEQSSTSGEEEEPNVRTESEAGADDCAEEGDLLDGDDDEDGGMTSSSSPDEIEPEEGEDGRGCARGQEDPQAHSGAETSLVPSFIYLGACERAKSHQSPRVHVASTVGRS